MIPRTQTTDIIVHGTWTPPSMDIGAREITRWHMDRDFETIGYHFVIRRSGRIEEGRHVDLMGAHVRGANASSIGICLVGGKNAKYDPAGDEPEWDFNYTYRQLVALGGLIGRLLEDYPTLHRVRGHRDYPHVVKACPGFDVEEMFGPGAKEIR